MGPADDATAVVSPRLLVYNVMSLRVVDASIMPRIPAAHTHAPVVMIAEKASDMIKEDWGEETDPRFNLLSQNFIQRVSTNKLNYNNFV